MKQLSLVMIVKNEEQRIQRCLDSVKDIVDEIIIVDTGSTDKTKEICLSYGAKVYDFKWNDNFSSARNFGLDKSSGDWNLVLDADEYLTSVDVKSIKDFINSKQKKIGLIKRINFFKQDDEIRQSSERISRLMPKEVRYEGAIHEQVSSTYPRFNVDMVLEHDGYLHEQKFDRNIRLLLNELNKNEGDSYIIYQLAKTYHNNKMYQDAHGYFEKYYKLRSFSTDAFYNTAITLYIYNSIKLNDFDTGLELIIDNFNLLQEEADFHFACGIFFMEAIIYDFNKYGEYYGNIEISYLNALEVGDSDTGVYGAGSFYAAYNLGIYYEMNNDPQRAKDYYSLAASFNYEPAEVRLKNLNLMIGLKLK